MKLYMFRTDAVSLIRSYSMYTQRWYMSYRFVDSLRAGSGWNCSSILILQSVYKPVWHKPSLSVQWITLDDGQRNCLKHVEFHFQNKFEKLMHLVGFIIRTQYIHQLQAYTDASASQSGYIKMGIRTHTQVRTANNQQENATQDSDKWTAAAARI
jgi:hypothetical protein